MTVAELIDTLTRLDPEARVYAPDEVWGDLPVTGAWPARNDPTAVIIEVA